MSFPFFFANRLFRHKGEEQRVSLPTMRIAVLGVAVGLVVMIVSTSVVLGFKSQIRSKVIGMGAHVEVMNVDSQDETEYMPIVTDDSLVQKIKKIPNVSHVQRYSSKLGMLKADSAFQGVLFKGIAQEYDVTFLRQHLVAGEIPALTDTASSGKILISRMMADNLGLALGGKVYAYFFEDGMKTRRYTIAGIYRTNMSQFDNNIILTDLYSVNKLNRWDSDQSSALEIYLHDFSQLNVSTGRINKEIARLQDRFGASYSAFSITERYAQIFDWLKLLDLNVWVILGLMMAVACFTMISGLLILILEKTNTIGVLKALGANNRLIRHVFLYYASFIIGRGLLWGNVGGLILLFVQHQWGIVKLDPLIYYVDSVPVLFDIRVLVLLNLGTLLLSMLVLIIPSFLVSRIQPAKAIRFD